MYFFEKKPEKVSMGKVVAVSAAVAVGVSALALILYKLYEKYCPCCDDTFDDYDECDYCDKDDCDDCADKDGDGEETPVDIKIDDESASGDEKAEDGKADAN